jgi:argininosuccinate lyase
VKSISGGIVSGYNKDLQETKEPLIKAFDLILETIAAVKAVIKNIRFDEKAVKARLSKGIAATDLVFELQKDGFAFRDAYRTAAGRIKEIEIDDSMIEKSIKNRVSRGSPGALNLKGYLKALENEKIYFVNTANRFKDKLAGLVE